MDVIIEPAKKLPVIQEADIVVLGGGCTGVFAAVRAARLGARVALVERSGSFGGTCTNGFVCVWHTLTDTTFKKTIIGGLTREIIDRLLLVPNGIKIVPPPQGDNVEFRPGAYSNYHLNTEELKIELDRLILEAKVMPYLHTAYSAVSMDGERIDAVIVESKSGRAAIRGKYFIDATGDGFLGADAGMEYYYHETLQPSTTAARVYGWNLLNDPNATLRNSQERIGCHIGWDDLFPGVEGIRNWFKSNVTMDCANAELLTKAEMIGRNQVREMMDTLREEDPRGKEIALAALSSQIGIRETRQLKCSYQITTDDICTGRAFEDAVGYCAYPVDIHHQDRKTSYRFLDGVEEIVEVGKESRFVRWREDDGPQPTFWQFPYRSMLPEKIPNLLICGRPIDADKGAFAAIRVMTSLNQTGEAAGVACYYALNSGKSVQDIDFRAMRRLMKRGGSVVLDD